MAELLGVVAGGAGLASLTIQLAEKAVKLSDLLKSVEELPSYVQEAQVHLHYLEQNARNCGALCSAGLGEDASGSGLDDLCRDLAVRLQRLLNELGSKMRQTSHKYSWGSMRIAMKKDEIKDLVQRVQRAHTLLYQ